MFKTKNAIIAQTSSFIDTTKLSNEEIQEKINKLFEEVEKIDFLDNESIMHIDVINDEIDFWRNELNLR